MSEIIYSDEFCHWIKSTVGLKITKEGLETFIKQKLQTLIETFQGDDAHFERFLKSITSDNNRVERKHLSRHSQQDDFKWTLEPTCGSTGCTVCTMMFDKILENHARKSSKKLKWNCHDFSQYISLSYYWWVVAKIFMLDNNEDNKKSKRPEDVDLLSLLTLMVNCKLFEDIWFLVIDVIEARNRLMHSASQTISEAEMKRLFHKMKKLLKKTSKQKLHELEKHEEERIFVTKTTTEVRVIIIIALELKQKALEYDIKKNQMAGQYTDDLQKFLDNTTAELKATRNNKASVVTTQEQDKKKIRELEEKCKRLEKRIHDLEEELESLKKKYDEEHTERLRLENELDDANKTIRSLREKIEDLRRKTKAIKMNPVRKHNGTVFSDIEEMHTRTMAINLVTVLIDEASLLECMATGAVGGGVVGGPVGAVSGAVFGAAIGIAAKVSRFFSRK